jgi:myo-inositol-1(or 4)-monophosphatase
MPNSGEPTFPITDIQQRLGTLEALLPSLGRELCQFQLSDLQIATKSNEIDLVTRADLHSERCLVEAIRSAWPDDGIIGEEGTAVVGINDGFDWIIDPIDGTVNYANGLPLWAISIALRWRGDVVAGLVAAPAMEWLFRAIRGQGASCNGKPIRVNQHPRLRSGLVATGFPYNRENQSTHLGEAVKLLLDHSGDVRRLGSAALDLCQVAKGCFAAYCENGLYAWDVAAGMLLVIEAGGEVTDLDGKPYDLFHSGGIIASNKRVHHELIAIAEPFRAACAARLKHRRLAARPGKALVRSAQDVHDE